ncbi:hypothetical protein [Actinospongicola halichondriae]|uniref:hypothetical protein n=1 Tax=Actinospongicola halichondriae TaxID=3236844 RepID=UPI003D386C07
MGKALIAVKIIDKVLPEKAFLNIFTLGGLLGSNETEKEQAEREAREQRAKAKAEAERRQREAAEKAAADEAERVAREKAFREREAFLKTPEGKKELARLEARELEDIATRIRVDFQQHAAATTEKQEWEFIKRPLFDPELEARDLAWERESSERDWRDEDDEPDASARKYGWTSMAAYLFIQLRDERIKAREKARARSRPLARWIAAGSLAVLFGSCGTAVALNLPDDGGTRNPVAAVAPAGPVDPGASKGAGPVDPGGASSEVARPGGDDSPQDPPPAGQPTPIPGAPPPGDVGTAQPDPAQPPAATPTPKPAPAPTAPTATVTTGTQCYNASDDGYLILAFATGASPGQTADIVMTSSVEPTPRTAQTTVRPDGSVEFALPIYENGETVEIQSLRIGGVDYATDFGTYEVPPLYAC